MIGSILLSAVGLFAAVSVAYLVTWYSGAGQTAAQTAAFATWLIGHVLLALNMRTEREPLLRVGLFSNRLMLAWAAATVVFVLVVTLVPPVHTLVKTSDLSPAIWTLVVGVTVVGTFWMEVRKWIGAPRAARPAVPPA